MILYLYGGFVASQAERSLSAAVKSVLEAWSRYFPHTPFTHSFASKGLDGVYRKWDQARFEERIQDSEFTLASFASFSNEDDAKAKRGHATRCYLSHTAERGTPCLIAGFEISHTLAAIDISRVIGLSDHIALGIHSESGHVHDLEDFADQNQKGPHYFRVSGKQLDPAKLVFDQSLGMEVVDVEQNPCHVHVVGPIDFTAAWLNYLGPAFLRAVGEASVESLENDVVRLRNDLIRVKLFEDPFDPHNPANVRGLWNFRRVLGIDVVGHSPTVRS